MSKPSGSLLAIAVPDGSDGTTSMVMDPLDGRDQIVATAAGSSWTEFERPLPALFHACVAANGGSAGIVVDVGANSGFYALLATCASATVRVLAFEPYRPVFEVLEGNIAANRACDRIEAIPLALSRQSGTATLYVPTQEHGLMETSSSLEAAFKQVHGETRVIETVTLDAFLATHPAARERVVLIKVDVEGHDAAVLSGARATIARWRPLLFVEVLPQAEHATLTGLLAEEDYVDIPIRPDLPLRQETEVRFHPDAWNHALVPAEAAAAFLRLPTA